MRIPDSERIRKPAFPKAIQVKFYEHDRDNYVHNLITIVVLFFVSRGVKAAFYARLSREMVIDLNCLSPYVNTLVNDRIPMHKPSKNENWYDRVTFGRRRKTRI